MQETEKATDLYGECVIVAQLAGSCEQARRRVQGFLDLRRGPGSQNLTQTNVDRLPLEATGNSQQPLTNARDS